jgi:transposase
MTEEEAKKLEKEIRDLKEQMAKKDQRIEELEAYLMRAVLRIEELERRLGKDSHTSSKPPSSDGLGRTSGKQRKKSGKRSGGQKGHQGTSLLHVLAPDMVIAHRPTHCESCQCDVHQETGIIKEYRQIHDIPEIRLQIVEHQVKEICCPACQHLTRATFPIGVDAPAHDGPHVQSLAVYLSQFQLLPMARTCEVLEDLCQCHLSEATLVNWIGEAATTLEPTMQRIKEILIASPFKHADEKRGCEALESIGIWPVFHGRAMHDRWSSYDHYPCAHSLCGAHLLRDCVYVAEQEKQPWAQKMFDLLLAMNKAADHWRAQGAKTIPKAEREDWIAQYFAVLAAGFRMHIAQAPPITSRTPKKSGRKKQDASKNLLDAL